MSKKHPTNIEFVKSMMEYSEYGALAQLFVIDALSKWANKISSIPLPELRKEFAGGFVNPDAWHGVAKEIKAKIEARS